MNAWLLAIALGFSGGPGIAQLPPPVPSPPELDQPIDGYDLRTAYQMWRYWVERQKGDVTEELLATPEQVEGLVPAGRLLRFTKTNDFGHYLTGEIRSYCKPRQPYGFEVGTCRYRLSRAYVPMPAASYGEENPVSRWTKANFDGPRLARHLRTIGMLPETDWWRADPAVMFTALPSAKAVLTENATVVRLDSADCPAMNRAIEALEGRTIASPIDLPTIGTDTQLGAPRPHATITTLTLEIQMAGGAMTMQGTGGALEQMVAPILDAADVCEKARG